MREVKRSSDVQQFHGRPVEPFMAGSAEDFHGLDAPVAFDDRFQYHFALHPIELGAIPLEFFQAVQVVSDNQA